MQPLFGQVKAIAHITGGGIFGNLPRVLPANVSVELSRGAWPMPAIFGVLQDLGQIPRDEMWHVFNMGLGLIVVTAPAVDCPGLLEVGRVIAGRDERVLIQ
jgi:phosphoribosylformylglycinamidine cyclo-ligase